MTDKHLTATSRTDLIFNQPQLRKPVEQHHVDSSKASSPSFPIEILSIIIKLAIESDLSVLLSLCHTCRCARHISLRAYALDAGHLVSPATQTQLCTELRLAAEAPPILISLLTSGDLAVDEHRGIHLYCDMVHLIRHQSEICRFILRHQVSRLEINMGCGGTYDHLIEEGASSFVRAIALLKPRAQWPLSIAIGGRHCRYAPNVTNKRAAVGTDKIIPQASAVMSHVSSVEMTHPRFSDRALNYLYPVYVRGEAVVQFTLVCECQSKALDALSIVEFPSLETFHLTNRDSRSVILDEKFIQRHRLLKTCILENATSTTHLLEPVQVLKLPPLEAVVLRGNYTNVVFEDFSRLRIISFLPRNGRFSPLDPDFCSLLRQISLILNESQLQAHRASLGLSICLPIHIGSHAQHQAESNACYCIRRGLDSGLTGITSISVELEELDQIVWLFICQWIGWFPSLESLLLYHKSDLRPSERLTAAEIRHVHKKCPQIRWVFLFAMSRKVESGSWGYDAVSGNWTYETIPNFP